VTQLFRMNEMIQMTIRIRYDTIGEFIVDSKLGVFSLIWHM